MIVFETAEPFFRSSRDEDEGVGAKYFNNDPPACVTIPLSACWMTTEMTRRRWSSRLSSLYLGVNI